MRYAIGEIVLVVIGILIALQINNWNTDRQETKELHSYLISIKNNLNADIISLKEINHFRHSSISFSKNYLNVAKSDHISIENFNTVENIKIRTGVFIDTYFKSKKSGFEGLKNSGLIGKLNGTDLVDGLNSYYYLIDKIGDQETSLNNTIEALENIAFQENIRQRLVEISRIENKETYFALNQIEIKKLLNHPSMTGANGRNSYESILPTYYQEATDIANSLISQIDKMVINE